MANNFMNLPTAEGQARIANSLEVISTGFGGLYPVKTWEDVQRVVRQGKAKDYFEVGDQLVSMYGEGEIVWEVIGFDHDKPTHPSFDHSMTLQSRDCLMNGQFSATQALAYTDIELSPGEQVLTFDGVQYSFTNTIAIPAKSQIVISSRDDYVPLKVSIYADADREAAIESDLTVSIVTNKTDTITEVNDKNRTRYGSNNYMESAMRQWLNSEETTFRWEGKTKFDRPSTYTTEGFLKKLDPELVKVIGKVDKQVANNTVTDGGGQSVFSDKVFLLSRLEVGLGTEGTTTGEKIYPFYDGVENAARIKTLNGSPRYWWLRSPYVGTSYYVRIVTTSGVVSRHYALYSSGVSPACVII